MFSGSDPAKNQFDARATGENGREAARLATLDHLNAVRPETDEILQKLVDDVRGIFGTELCLVNLALVDKLYHRAWSGELPDEQAKTRTIPQDHSTCPDVVETRTPLVVEDFQTDERFGGHELFTLYGMRFYAGAPLVTSHGVAIGTLCLLDPQPREFSEGQLVTLEAFARAVAERLELIGALEREQAAREREAQRRRELQQILDTSPDMIATVGLDGVFKSMNPACKTILGYEPEELIGRFFKGLIYPDDRERATGAIRAVLVGRSSTGFETRCLRENGGTAWIEWNATPLPEEGAILWIGRDVTERKRAQTLVDGQKHVLELIAAGASLPEVLEVLARFIEKHSEDALCSIMLLDEDGTNLRLGAAPSLPDSYNRAVDGMAVGPSESSCGTAVYREEAVVVPDIASDPLWAQSRNLALRHGLRACWSTPIFSKSDHVLGTFAMYYREPRGPGPRDLQLIEVATHVVGIAVERERAERELRESEERFRSLVRNSSDIIVVSNPDGTVRYVSPSAERVLGYPPEALIGLTATEVFGGVHPDDAERVRIAIARARDDPGVTSPIEFRIRHADGSWRCLEAIGNNLLDEPSVRGMVFNGRDVTERKVLEEQLTYRAFHDSLTNLPNRALFMSRLEHALARSKRLKDAVAVLFMDLDNFKVVNDYLGHAVGDQLLVQVGERISACLRVTDTAARLGGDEFTVLLEDVAGEGEATRVARRIMEGFKGPFTLGNQEVFVTASMGISLGASGDDRPENLLRDADIAMYRAKNKGKARYQVFDPNMDFYARERLRTESDLRQAIERGEFRVYYQPEVLPNTGEIFGVEALVRWEHPENGLVLPARFIRIAEETGLILPIGRWVLEEACRQAREWHEQHPSDPPLLLSVNLSARQFQHPDLAQDVAQVLRETGLDPSRLNLEITESAVMEDAQSTIGTLRQLKALGLQIAVDDFGAGYSSLSYLKRFPVDYLKIDRSFIEGLGKHPEDEVLVSGIVGLARALGLRVVAEGVETAEQLARLRETRCDLAQGNFFSKPLPAEAASALLARKRAR